MLLDLGRWMTPGILPSALQASLRLFKIVADDLVEPPKAHQQIYSLSRPARPPLGYPSGGSAP